MSVFRSGRVGVELVGRLTKGGQKCIVYDVNPRGVKNERQDRR